MNKKLTAIILTAVLTFALAGCMGKDTTEIPETGTSTETEVDQSAQTTDGTDDAADSAAVLDRLRGLNSGTEDDTAEEAPAADNGEYFLSRYLYSRYFHTIDEAGNVTGTFDRYEIAQKVGDRGSRYVNLYDAQSDFYSGSLCGYDGRFLYFRDYRILGTDSTNSYVVYAVDTTDYEPYLIWRSQPDDGAYIDTVEYYKGALHIAVNHSRDSEGHLSKRYENCYTFDEAKKEFTETSAGLEALFEASIARDYNVMARMGYELNERQCFAHTMDEVGWVLAMNDGEYACITADGEVTPIAPLIDDDYPYIATYDDKYIYFSNWDSSTYKYRIYCYDLGRERARGLTLPEESATVLGYLDGALYYSIESVPEYGYPVHTIYSYNGGDGRSVKLYEAESVPGAQFTPGTEGFRIIGDRLYYIAFSKDKLEWVSADAHTQDDTAKPVGCVEEELELFRYGQVDSSSEESECPYCGTTLYQYYAENFVLDDKYSPNAAKINSFLKDRREAFFGSMDNDEYAPVDDSQCEYHKEYPVQNCITDDLNVGGVEFIGDGKYLAVSMNGYWYGGGAHGYPNREQYLFDLETGEQVTIGDLYTGSEEEYKDLVAQATVDDYLSYSSDTSPYSVGDSRAVYAQAYDEASFDSPNIEFNADSVTVYYPPYDMGPYASGYIEVVIPYQDLNIDM